MNLILNLAVFTKSHKISSYSSVFINDICRSQGSSGHKAWTRSQGSRSGEAMAGQGSRSAETMAGQGPRSAEVMAGQDEDDSDSEELSSESGNSVVERRIGQWIRCFTLPTLLIQTMLMTI